MSKFPFYSRNVEPQLDAMDWYASPVYGNVRPTHLLGDVVKLK